MEINMKTRQEMIYDFMVALAANPAYYTEGAKMDTASEELLVMASALANKYLESLG
jgi:hypothetical protein